MKIHLYALMAFLGFCFLQNSVFCQTTFEYDYDDAGNRTTRIVIGLKTSELNSQDSSSAELKGDAKNSWSKEPIIDNSFDGIQLNIFPNPTLGKLNIVATNLPANSNCHVQIYNSQGQLIVKQPWTKDNSIIDLSKMAQGTYIVKFQYGSELTEWKVIKE